jgi:hypothetical protein
MALQDKDIIAKITEARADRQKAQAWIDECLRFAMPLTTRIGSPNTQVEPDDEDQLFDTTLQDTTDDFGSDMNHLFTPRHEKWVQFEPSKQLSDGEKRQISEAIQAQSEMLFTEIERSNFYEHAGEAYRSWAITVAAISITDPGSLQPIFCQHIELPELMLARGPLGSFDGRYREWPVMKKADMAVIWPSLFPSIPEIEGKKKVTVVDGWTRDWSDPALEAWWFSITVNNKVEHKQRFEGPGSCGFIVSPWRKSKKTAWMPGPVKKALPPARTLDELAYIYLKALNRDVDPAMSYEEDGIMNPEGGIDAGVWLARAPGSEAPSPIRSESRLDASVFEREKLELKIKKALYQDRPDQAGKTPPTATQWMDEKAWNTRRMELPRDLATNEWVLPIINRFAYIMAQRGQPLDITVNKSQVELRPKTPLSKARDVEDLQNTMQVMGMVRPILEAEAMNTPINSRATIERILETADERHIVLFTEEEIAQRAEQQATLQAIQSRQTNAQPGAEGTMNV